MMYALYAARTQRQKVIGSVKTQQFLDLYNIRLHCTLVLSECDLI